MNSVKNLNIPNYKNCDCLAENINDLTLKAPVKWRNHPSILAIAWENKNRANFSFNFIFKEDAPAEIKALDFSKTIQENGIPIKITETNDNIFAEAICYYFQKSLANGKFPNYLKLANIRPVFKRSARSSKNNYRSVSILAIFSKIFERLLSKHFLQFFDNILSNFQCGFRRGYRTQHCLLLMLVIWK